MKTCKFCDNEIPDSREICPARVMINAKLKHLRQSAGLKQSYLAHKLGVSQTNISELESGHINPTIETLELYSTFFNKGSVKETLIKHFE